MIRSFNSPYYSTLWNLISCRNLVSKYEDGRSVISPVPSESKDIALLLLEHGRPLVGEMTKENELTLYHQRPLLVAYYDVDWHRQLKKGNRTSNSGRSGKRTTSQQRTLNSSTSHSDSTFVASKKRTTSLHRDLSSSSTVVACTGGVACTEGVACAEGAV